MEQKKAKKRRKERKKKRSVSKDKTAAMLGSPQLNFIIDQHICFLVCHSVVQRVANPPPGWTPSRPTWPTLPALSVDDDSPNGEGSMLRYFLGDEDEDDGVTGMHLRLLGDVGLISGSKSMVLFRVAPHAMTSVC